jgi:hypothetical protein
MIQNIKLDNVTLLTMSTIDIENHVKALMFSSENIEFGEIKLISFFHIF